MEAPMILTLALDENAFLFFNSLRKIYFPPERNFVEAHLTLFHQLPPEPYITETLAALSRDTSSFSMEVTKPVSTGRGVAYLVESETLASLHQRLQEQWRPLLIPQDLQKFRPHVTVQNKVSGEEAAGLLQFLQSSFSGFPAQATGLQLWEYQNGPWQLHRSFPFGKES